MKRILICLEKIGIGGVETAVLNMAISLSKKNKVLVIAKRGIYEEKLKEFGISYIQYDFKITNNFNKKKLNYLKNIITFHGIDEIHIHQIPCYQYLIPIALELNISYISFIHSNILGSYDWFMKTYSLYKRLLPIAFNNASLIVAISETAAKEIQTKFLIDKIVILKNSINFSLYRSNKKIKSIKNFLLISRFAEEKFQSILCAIEFFEKCQLYNDQIKLTIVGDGVLKTKILKRCQNIRNCEVIPATHDIASLISKNDVILGMGRCIIEGLAEKKLCIVSSYNKKLIFINDKTIDKANQSNFNGMNFTRTNINEFNLFFREEEIKDLTDQNYKFIKYHLDIDENLKCLDEKQEFKIKYLEYKDVFDIIYELQKLKNKIIKLEKEKYISEQKLYKENAKIYNELLKSAEDYKTLLAENQKLREIMIEGELK